MTIRAVLLGLLGAAFIAATGYINDMVLGLTPMVGNHLPIIVFGLVIVFALAVNPLVSLIHPNAPLKHGELATIVALLLVACSIPGAGLMWTFVPSLALPAEYYQQDVTWQRHDVMSYVPHAMLPLGGQFQESIIGPLARGGAGSYGKALGMGEVPWNAWTETLATWLPIVLLIGIAGICVALIVHPQWSRRERLRYPVAQFARSLLERAPGQAMPAILRDRIFWIGFGVVFAIHLINGLNAWELLNLEIPMTANLERYRWQFPVLGKLPGADRIFLCPIYPTVIAFSFFLASDVALSLGISHPLRLAVMAVLLGAGVNVSEDYLTGGPFPWQYFGSYLGLALLMLYMGRRYYGQVLREGLGLSRSREGVEPASIWAFRILLVVFALLVAFLAWRVHLPLPLGGAFVLLVLLLFTVMARINAESGLFWAQAYWHPITVFLGLFGATALGPQNFIIIAMLCVVLTIDPRESLLPFVVNGLKIADDAKVSPARTSRWAVAVLILALLVATPVALWAGYNYGANHNGWTGKMVPKMPFDALARQIQEMKGVGTLEASTSYGLWDRFANMQVDWKGFGLWAGLGVGLVLLCSVLRLRLPWWPLHPILFLVWGTFPLGFFYLSFLIGWAAKSIITRLGSSQAYFRARQMMVGVLAGDLIGGLLFMAAGALYHVITGEVPPKYAIFP